MPAKETLKKRSDIDYVGKEKEEASSVEVSSVAFEQVGSGVLRLIQRQRVALVLRLIQRQRVALESKDDVGGSEASIPYSISSHRPHSTSLADPSTTMDQKNLDFGVCFDSLFFQWSVCLVWVGREGLK